MQFDVEMGDMKNCRLQITELHFDEGIDPHYREKLQRLLHNGDMVITA